jgi:hypothetical protein
MKNKKQSVKDTPSFDSLKNIKFDDMGKHIKDPKVKGILSKISEVVEFIKKKLL